MPSSILRIQSPRLAAELGPAFDDLVRRSLQTNDDKLVWRRGEHVVERVALANELAALQHVAFTLRQRWLVDGLLVSVPPT